MQENDRQEKSMKWLAQRLGVSKATVSLALRNSGEVSLATRQRVQALAAQVGYSINPQLGQTLSQVRRRGRFRGTLGLINGNADATAFQRHPTIPEYINGVRARSRQLGYSTDEFWLYEAAMSGERLAGILRARGVAGVLLVGLMDDAQFPRKLESLLGELPLVVTGVRTRRPTLPCVCSDHHAVAQLAMEHALRLGYRRPAMVLDREIDRLVEGRFSAGFLHAQLQLPISRRIRPYFTTATAADSRREFADWMRGEQPDVIFCLYNEVEQWLLGMGLRLPREMGLIQLEWRRAQPRWAGIDQHNDLTGIAAVDTLVGMIHRGESAVDPHPRTVLIPPTWRDGLTVVVH